MENRFSRFINRVNKAPLFLQSFLLSKFFCTMVKFAGTAKVKLVKVSHHEVELALANKKKVQNHIGGVHALAAGLLAESATGIVFGMNVPDTCVPLLKSMNIQYQRRMQGSLTAKASLTDAQISQINSADKGDLLVPVVITDESGQEPIVCEMEWAWVTKRK